MKSLKDLAAGFKGSRLAAAAALAAATLFAKAARLETQHEGRRAHVYDDHDGASLHDGIRDRDGLPCKGHPTVGIGCNLDRGGARFTLGAVGANYAAVRAGHADLTDEQIDRLFEDDLKGAMVEVRALVPDLDELPEAVKLVLFDMTFNMGSVRGFPRMLAAIERRDWQGMIAEMLDSKWAREDVPTRAKHDVELIRQLLVPDLDPPHELTAEDRAQALALVAIATDQTIAEALRIHMSEDEPSTVG